MVLEHPQQRGQPDQLAAPSLDHEAVPGEPAADVGAAHERPLGVGDPAVDLRAQLGHRGVDRVVRLAREVGAVHGIGVAEIGVEARALDQRCARIRHRAAAVLGSSAMTRHSRSARTSASSLKAGGPALESEAGGAGWRARTVPSSKCRRRSASRGVTGAPRSGVAVRPGGLDAGFEIVDPLLQS